MAGEMSDYNSFCYTFNNPIILKDPDGQTPITGLIGAAIGAVIGGGIEIGSQLINNGSINNWKAIGGAALQGGVTGGAAGLTGGASLFVTAGVAGGANVVGGAANRAIQGQGSTLSNIAMDATVGAVFGAGGKLLGSGLNSLTSSVTKQATTNLTNIASKVVKQLEAVGMKNGPVYGSKAHKTFADLADGMKIGDNVIRTEVSYLNGKIVDYGTKGSARLDAGLYNSKNELIQAFDLKTGGAKLTSKQVEHIQNQTGKQIPVTEIRAN